MKTVINKTRTALRVPLPRGKALRLAPGKTGQIRDDAAEHAALKKLVEAGEIEVVEGGGKDAGGTNDAEHSRGATQGHGKSTIRRTGDR